MISKNWSGKSAPACATISLLLCLACGRLAAQDAAALPQPATAPTRTPAIALIDAADAPQ